ncbi:MAG: metal ABC transporter permease [Candidatus Omnitrophica bacterium]|nr:metal ABC transporter permease [Candidatus Omnitrophota bacterium]
MDFLISIFSDYTLQVVTAGALILGITSGVLGTFAVLRQQSLLGDAISHATLPGVGIAFFLTQSKDPLVLLIGAAISGWVGTLLINLITETTRIKRDTALGIILSVFFGFGLVMITIVQRMPTATKAGLDKFLFGNAATLLYSDVELMMNLAGLALLLIFIFWKEFKVITFDKDFAQSLGLPVQRLEILLTSLIVIAIVIGLQTVGVVLMSAMLVAPAASARQWTDRLGIMIVLSALFGATAGVAGAITSSLILKLPTGPMIVIYLSVIVLFSLILAPNRGLLWDWLRAARHRQKMHTTTMLKNLLLFSEIQTNPFHPHDIAALKAIGKGPINKTMVELSKKGWAKQYPDKRWALTSTGLNEARRLTEEFEEQFESME